MLDGQFGLNGGDQYSHLKSDDDRESSSAPFAASIDQRQFLFESK
jgi:hypothetical protein